MTPLRWLPPLLLSALQPLQADESLQELDAILEGFEESTLPVETVQPALAFEAEGISPDPERLRLRGHWINSASWAFAHSAEASGRPDYQGWNRLSSKLWLELEQRDDSGWRMHGDGHLRYDLAYDLKGRSSYPQAVLDRYQRDVEVGELWIAGPLQADLDLKLGRQIAVWGHSDYLRVNDTLNPLDLREPGLTEIETLRRPLLMVRGDYYRGPWSVSLLAIPEQRSNLTAPCGGEYAAIGARTEAECVDLTLPQQFPEDGLKQMEWGLSAIGRFSGWDLSLYGARLNHDTPYQYDNTLYYARVNQLGAGLNVAEGSWLWKGELAWFDGLQFSDQLERSRLDLLLGGEYRGIDDVTLSLEVVRREIGNYQSALLAKPDYQQRVSWQTLLAYQHSLRHDTLHLKGVVMRTGASLNEGGYSRFSAQYDLDDSWSVSGGGIWYQGSLLPPDWGSNDRLFVELRQDF